MADISLESMHHAVTAKEELPFRDSFSSIDFLPSPLEALDRISSNFRWSWARGGVDIFRDIDPYLWDDCEQNPRLFLTRVDPLRLWQRASDPEYISRLGEFTALFDKYLSEPASTFGIVSPDRPAAYFCAEYGVHNSLPNYSGGLGILAGDHLKSASDINLPLVAVGLLYRYGYFRQKIGHDGWQEERYSDVFGSELALTPVTAEDGSRLLVTVHIRGRAVHAQAWLAKVGRISLYLLDTNVAENVEIDRLITGHLYGGSSETRIVQEKILGIGGVRLLRELKVNPSVFHLNEGHSAFLTLELASEFLRQNPEADFEEAREAVRAQCVFTTHTPVAAGNDVFEPDDLRDCFDENFIRSLKVTDEEFFGLGRVNPSDHEERFGMTPFALRMCRSANGVAEKHGEVSRDLWLKMFADAETPADVPITHVTNGVHVASWIAPLLQELLVPDGSDIARAAADEGKWAETVAAIADEDLWAKHLTLKSLLVSYIRDKTRKRDTGDRETINEHRDTRQLFSPEVLTIGFARRVAAYKRWDLLVSDLDRLLKMIDNAERPIQFVFAGKAHPQDRTAKQILQQLMSIDSDSNWQHRAVFLEDYDQDVARYLVQGVDVWMNVPRRPLEASGTSGMKAAMNGALNFSVLDGWWIEGYNGENGFAINDLEVGDDEAATDLEDASAVYDLLENTLVPEYYDRDDAGLPRRWIQRMKNSIATLTPAFSSDRMVTDYVEKIYN